jgi:hypothetical protein
MAQEIGESRETLGRDVMKMAEDMANNMKKEVKPFYIVYAAKLDKAESNRIGKGVIRQTMKAYYNRPAPMLGILVWYVNHPLGIFEFQPQLSAPPDVPVDPSLLGTKSEDLLPTVMEKGKDLNVLVS